MDSPEQPGHERKRDRLVNETRQLIADWDAVLNPPDRDLYFEFEGEIPPFQTGKLDRFSVTNAWWLAELCRLAYTPDAKEAGRFWNREKPPRRAMLEGKTTFREIHSVHKTGNHASIYLGESEGSRPFTVLCFRGTSKFRQWVMNFTASPRGWEFIDRNRGITGAFVHSGFDIFFKRIWPKLHHKLLALPRPFVFTGHSLGGALANLAAVEERPDLLVTFGAPKAGNAGFSKLLDEIPHHRLINDLDLVPHVPPADPGAGEREFFHSGSRIFLGRQGQIVDSVQPGLDESLDPLHLLREAFRQPVPPACVVDHLMVSYCRKLRAGVGINE
ncbi:MAG: lipase family protein [Verrucomicrobiales bacterium]|nr:lipase family protein [Verrucomicrobiales bacterium]